MSGPQANNNDDHQAKFVVGRVSWFTVGANSDRQPHGRLTSGEGFMIGRSLCGQQLGLHSLLHNPQGVSPPSFWAGL